MSPKELRDILCDILPANSVYCIAFVGGSVLEVLIDEAKRKEVDALMTAINHLKLQISDPLGDVLKKPRPADVDRTKKGVRMALRRASRIANRHKSQIVSGFFESLAKRAQSVLDGCDATDLENTSGTPQGSTTR